MLTEIEFEGKNDAIKKIQVMEVLERLIEISGCHTSAELAVIIKVNPSIISAMRSGSVRLRREHLQIFAKNQAVDLSRLCEMICSRTEKVIPKHYTHMFAQRKEFLRYYKQEGLAITKEEHDAVNEDGFVMPSLLNKIFATKNEKHITFLTDMQLRITDHRAKDPHFTGSLIINYAMYGDGDELDEEPQKSISDTNEECTEESKSIIVKDDPTMQTASSKKAIFSSKDIEEAAASPKKLHSVHQISLIILNTALQKAMDDEKKTVSVSNVCKEIAQKIPEFDVRYDPRDTRITLIDEKDTDAATTYIPHGYSFVA